MDREARLAAVARLEALLRQRPDDPNALNNLAVHARALGDTSRATALLRRAIAVDAANPAYHANLGNACAAAGDSDGAIEAYRAALACDPGRPAAAIQLAGALHRARRLEEGAAVAADALTRDPGSGALHNVLGALLNSQRRYEAAAAHFRQAIALAPDRIDARINFAIAAMQLGQHQSALAELDAAIAAAGESAELLAHQGQALVSMGRLRDGLDRITRALALDPGNLDARLGRSRALFLLGEYESAWQAYDARWLRPDNPRPDVGIPLWQDEDPAGRAIFVVNEQGLGDTINFCRFLPMLAARARRVCLACQEPLVDLLRTSLPGVQVVPAGKRPRDLEFAIPLLDLPPRLGRFAPWWPGAAYLKASRPSPVALPSDGKRKVGLVWAGNPDHGNDRFRSLGLESLLFLGGDPRVRLVALQKGPAAAARTRLGAEALIMDAGERLYSFADTAALIERLDLVIAVDTAVAHLAGAMGKPAWILLPAAPDWRWGVAGERSGWYPSLRLFRQQTIGDWTGPLAALRDAWTTWLDGTGTHPDRPPP
jgi:tetratricopeptide (TPR) repeat protein